MTQGTEIALFDSGRPAVKLLPRARLVQSPQPRATTVRPHASGAVYLFIYRIRHRYDAYSWVDNIRYCTVFARATHIGDAERIAINSVHQHGWRVLKTDTATAFDWAQFGDDGADAAHVANLREFGVSFRLNR